MGKDELFVKGDKKAIWEKYCGFLELSLQEFMQIQEDLLLDQIELVASTPIGRKIMNNRKPASVAEFRRQVPLTIFDDYAPYLDQRIDEALPVEPYCWVHTSGRSGTFKWVPYTERAYNKAIDLVIAGFILACATKRGDVNLSGRERIIQNLPPRPYWSGMAALSICERLGFRTIPPLEVSEKMDFHERIAEGFKMSLRTGVDMIASISSVLVKVGESFSERMQGVTFSPFMLHPAVLLRLLKAIISSKLQRRTLLPKDLWPVKAIICSGTDTVIYRDLLLHYWGREPYEYYASTEAGFTAIQSWTKKALTFAPYSSFLEFVPENELLKWRQDRGYEPSTILINEVKAGERYELIVSSFYGMPFLRYRVGDLIKIVSLRDEEAGIDIPQMVFESRADDLIDIAAFARLGEKDIWQAINDTGVRYEDWTIRKEYEQGQPVLHLYIELKEIASADTVGSLLHDSLKVNDPDYNDLDRMLEIRPVRVSVLSRGTFERYLREKQAAGFDLAHLKPAHTNVSDTVISDLIRLSGGA